MYILLKKQKQLVFKLGVSTLTHAINLKMLMR